MANNEENKIDYEKYRKVIAKFVTSMNVMCYAYRTYIRILEEVDKDDKDKEYCDKRKEQLKLRDKNVKLKKGDENLSDEEKLYAELNDWYNKRENIQKIVSGDQSSGKYKPILDEYRENLKGIKGSDDFDITDKSKKYSEIIKDNSIKIKDIVAVKEGIEGIPDGAVGFEIGGYNYGYQIEYDPRQPVMKYYNKKTEATEYGEFIPFSKTSFIHFAGTGLNIRCCKNDYCWEYDEKLGCKQVNSLVITFNDKFRKRFESVDTLYNAYTEDTHKEFKEFIDYYIKEYNNMVVNECVELLEHKNNIILQGAPGTGKTYITDSIVLGLIGNAIEKGYVTDKDRVNITESINKYKKGENAQLAFCTFHQSMDYDDFVIGLRPVVKNNGIVYEPKAGIFKVIADNAKVEYINWLKAHKKWEDEGKKEDEPELKKYVLVIDEINRGNISKIFGELITLLEKGKRLGSDQEISVKLPYLPEDDEDKDFSLSPNLYIIGTMNTTDRSAGNLDYAIRRRFAFKTLKSELEDVTGYYKDKNQNVKKIAEELFKLINEKNGDKKGFIDEYKDDNEIDLEDLKIGISYFMAESKNELRLKLEYEIIPLIKEYIKDGLLRKEENAQEAEFKKWKEKVKSIPED